LPPSEVVVRASTPERANRRADCKYLDPHPRRFADFARVLGVVVEVFLLEHPVLVTDQPVRGNLRRVELDLDLDVLGDGDAIIQTIDVTVPRDIEAVLARVAADKPLSFSEYVNSWRSQLTGFSIHSSFSLTADPNPWLSAFGTSAGFWARTNSYDNPKANNTNPFTFIFTNCFLFHPLVSPCQFTFLTILVVARTRKYVYAMAFRALKLHSVRTQSFGFNQHTSALPFFSYCNLSVYTN
jgi:hypothetical protein